MYTTLCTIGDIKLPASLVQHRARHRHAVTAAPMIALPISHTRFYGTAFEPPAQAG